MMMDKSSFVTMMVMKEGITTVLMTAEGGSFLMLMVMDKRDQRRPDDDGQTRLAPT